jgi:hypothetical protein
MEELEGDAADEMSGLEKQILKLHSPSIEGMKAKIAVATDELRTARTFFDDETGERELRPNSIWEEIIFSLEQDAGIAPEWRFEETPAEHLAALKAIETKARSTEHCDRACAMMAEANLGSPVRDADPVLPLFDRWREARLKYRSLVGEPDADGMAAEEPLSVALTAIFKIGDEIAKTRAVSYEGLKAKIAVAADLIRTHEMDLNPATGELCFLEGTEQEVRLVISIANDAGILPEPSLDPSPGRHARLS